MSQDPTPLASSPLRQHIGRTSAPRTVEIDPGHIARFAEAIGDPNPIYRDEAVARAAGHPRIPAPPTFATALRPNDVRQGLDIDWSRILHGEQEFRYERPLYAGDVLTLTHVLRDVYEKSGKSGVMDFLVLDIEARDPAGVLVYVGRSVVVVRRLGEDGNKPQGGR
ncbi:MAG TPA: MaoC family dehydratase N-terminal domain-containing protein [Polyangia bacterium]|jgi:acyl dehydratase|nr:MaoC family dehydratase N-terminal domain-containing protein [Polyangia bacterium]